MLRIHKTLKLTDVAFAIKGEGEAMTFEGYASVFGGVDSYGDTILKGAFESTLRTHGKPKMFFNHVWGMPIGKYAVAKEDDHGLFVVGELTPGLSLANDVRAAMRHLTLDGLSIGGFVKSGDYDETDTGRVIRKWSKLVEVSPVVFPADEAARIDPATVKHIDFEALLPECKSERDIERLLRDAGLGKWEAMAVVSRAKTIFSGRDASRTVDAKAMADLASRFQRLESLTA